MRFTLAPTIEELMDELQHQGWSAGDVRIDNLWMVYCTKHDHVINVTHNDRTKAWELAVGQARLWGLVRQCSN